MRETSTGTGSLRRVVLVAGAIDGLELVAVLTDGLECTVRAALGDGNGCSVYLIRLRGNATCAPLVGLDICKE